MTTRKPPGYWTPENVDEAFDGLRKAFGRVPSYKEFTKAHGGVMFAIENGRYDTEIRTYRQYLAHRGLPTTQLWTSEKVDNVFDELKQKLGRRPTLGEFSKNYPGATDSIFSGRYDTKIKTWKEYLAHRNLSPHRQSWTQENTDEVFDKLTEKLGRPPTSKEFKKSNSSAMDFIIKGRYNTQITTWRQYLAHRNLSSDIQQWTPEKIDETFDEMQAKLGRNPTVTEYAERYGGALSAITRGRYNSNVRNWIEYLTHRNLNASIRIWTPQKIDDVFDKTVKEIGRTPTWEEFRKASGGAVNVILQGRYNPSIKTWKQYLVHRGLLKISTPEDLSEFLEQNPTARSLVGLADFNGYGRDIASVLKELFPDRFVDEEDLARMLAKSTISGAMYPFTVNPGPILPPVDLVPPELPAQVKGRLEDIVYRISIEYYGPQFNRDPRETLTMLDERGQNSDPFVAGLMRKIKEYYEGLFEFEIPGIGRLKDKR